jgi:hypothetical protein
MATAEMVMPGMRQAMAAPPVLPVDDEGYKDYKLDEMKDRDRQEVRLHLDEGKRKLVVAELSGLVTQAETDMGPKIDQWKRADVNYRGKIPQRTHPWTGASSVGMPRIKSKLRVAARRITAAFFRNRPAIPVEPKESSDVGRVEKIEAFLDHEVRHEIHLRKPIYQIALDAGKYGIGWAKVTFCIEQEPVTEVQVYDGASPDDQARFMRNFPNAHERYPEYAFRVFAGQRVELNVSWKKTVYRGVRVDRIHPKHVIRPAGYSDWKRLPYIFEKMQKSWYELQEGVQNKMYDKDALDAIKARYENDPKAKDKYEYIKKKYDVYEGYWRYSPRGDSLREKCLFTFIPDEHVLLRGIKYPYKHGHPYLVPFEVMPDADNLEGESMAEDMADIQAAETAIINIAIDSDTANYPMYKVRRNQSGAMSFDTMTAYPGKVWELDDMDDLQQLQSFTTSANSIALMDRVVRIGDDLTSITELMTGRESSSDPKAPAAKTQMLLERSDEGMSEMTKTFVEGWVEMSFQIIELYSQYGTAGKEFRILNEEGEMAFDTAPDDLRVRPDMEPHGGEVMFTQTGKRDTLIALAQFLQQDPTYQQYVIQPSPQTWIRVLERITENWGAGVAKIVHEVIPTPEQIRQQQIEIQLEALKQHEEQKAAQMQQQMQQMLMGGVPAQGPQMAPQQMMGGM